MRRAILLGLMLLLATLPPVHGAPALPQALAFDATGDQKAPPGQPNGPLVVTAPAFKQVDLLEVDAVQDASGALNLTLLTSAAATATENFTLAFEIAKGPTSHPSSKATGQVYAISVAGGKATGVVGAVVQQVGTSMSVTFPAASVGAVGGDVLTGLVAWAHDTDGGSVPPPVTQDDSSAIDRIPDSGTAKNFTLARAPDKPNLAIVIVGGTIRDVNCAMDALSCIASTFNGSNATTNLTAGVVAYDLAITNGAIVPDTVTVSTGTSVVSNLGSFTFNRTSFVVLAGATQHVIAWQGFRYEAAPRQILLASEKYGHIIYVASVLGAHQEIQPHLTTLPPPTAAARAPIPSGLGFLTPVVEAIGLDSLLGDYAELGLLLFLVLLAVIFGYLLLFLNHTPWVRVRVHPRRAIVAPGGFAEFRFRLDNAKGAIQRAQASLRSDGAWVTGLVVGRKGGQIAVAGEPIEVGVQAGQADSEGTVRIQVPESAQPNEKGFVDFDVVPLDADGTPRPEHKATARISVQTPAADVKPVPKASDIQLAQVRHEPVNPLPGGTVSTSATIRNDGPSPAPLRVVLLVDGMPLLEERVEVPARGSRIVQLPWKAGPGKNQVKVQVFLA